MLAQTPRSNGFDLDMTMHLKAGLAALALLVSGPALAADLYSRKGALPPAPVLPEYYSWTGFYAGGQIGYSWASSRTRFVALNGLLAGTGFDHDSDGLVGGAHVGFNYQFGSIVLGVEGDIEGVDARSSFNDPLVSGRTSRDWQASVRGRIGFAFDRFMIYGSAGGAFTEFDYRLTDPATGLSDSSGASRTGWTGGGGVSYAFTTNLIGGVEYRYTDYGRFSRFARTAFPGLGTQQETSLHTVRTSISYKF